MTRFVFLTTLLLAALAAPLRAQHCSTLTVSGNGYQGTMMTLSLTGAQPDAMAFLAFSQTEGLTRFDFGAMGMLELGLAQPMFLDYVGQTDSNGRIDVHMGVPNHMGHQMHMFAQGFSMMMQMRHGHPHHMSFCTSNVMGFGYGGHHH